MGDPSECDLNDFQRKLTETLTELDLNRKLLVEQKTEIENVKSEVSFLQQELVKAQQEKDYLQKQLAEAKKISRHREEEWSNFRDNWSQNKVKYEIANKSFETFKLQISNQQLEISKLKVEKEELDRQIHEYAIWKETCTVTKERVQCTMDTLVKQLRNLEQDHIRLTSSINTANNVANKTDQFKQTYESHLKKITTENDLLKRKVVELEMQLEVLQLTSTVVKEADTDMEHFDPIKMLDEWKTYQKENHAAMLQNISEIGQSYTTLAKLQATELQNSKLIKDLEQQLEKEKELNRKPEVQNVECQTIILVENAEDLVNKLEGKLYNEVGNKDYLVWCSKLEDFLMETKQKILQFEENVEINKEVVDESHGMAVNGNDMAVDKINTKTPSEKEDALRYSDKTKKYNILLEEIDDIMSKTVEYFKKLRQSLEKTTKSCSMESQSHNTEH